MQRLVIGIRIVENSNTGLRRLIKETVIALANAGVKSWSLGININLTMWVAFIQ